jgi:hypothetical protein
LSTHAAAITECTSPGSLAHEPARKPHVDETSTWGVPYDAKRTAEMTSGAGQEKVRGAPFIPVVVIAQVAFTAAADGSGEADDDVVTECESVAVAVTVAVTLTVAVPDSVAESVGESDELVLPHADAETERERVFVAVTVAHADSVALCVGEPVAVAQALVVAEPDCVAVPEPLRDAEPVTVAQPLVVAETDGDSVAEPVTDVGATSSSATLTIVFFPASAT